MKSLKNSMIKAAMTLLLAVMTTAKGWAAEPDRCLDYCYVVAHGIHVQGWAYDPDASSTSIDVHVYVYTDEGCTSRYGDIHVLKANVSRPDVNKALGITAPRSFRTNNQKKCPIERKISIGQFQSDKTATL